MDRRIDERLRKPRRAKGTPFYIERNYWAAGVLALGGFCWFLLEFTPGFKRFKKHQKEYFQDSEEVKLRIQHQQIALTNPVLDELLIKARERAAYKDEPKPQGLFAKLFSGPDC